MHYFDYLLALDRPLMIMMGNAGLNFACYMVATWSILKASLYVMQ